MEDFGYFSFSINTDKIFVKNYNFLNFFHLHIYTDIYCIKMSLDLDEEKIT